MKSKRQENSSFYHSFLTAMSSNLESYQDLELFKKCYFFLKENNIDWSKAFQVINEQIGSGEDIKIDNEVIYKGLYNLFSKGKITTKELELLEKSGLDCNYQDELAIFAFLLRKGSVDRNKNLDEIKEKLFSDFNNIDRSVYIYLLLKNDGKDHSLDDVFRCADKFLSASQYSTPERESKTINGDEITPSRLDFSQRRSIFEKPKRKSVIQHLIGFISPSKTKPLNSEVEDGVLSIIAQAFIFDLVLKRDESLEVLMQNISTLSYYQDSILKADFLFNDKFDNLYKDHSLSCHGVLSEDSGANKVAKISRGIAIIYNALRTTSNSELIEVFGKKIEAVLGGIDQGQLNIGNPILSSSNFDEIINGFKAFNVRKSKESSPSGASLPSSSSSKSIGFGDLYGSSGSSSDDSKSDDEIKPSSKEKKSSHSKSDAINELFLQDKCDKLENFNKKFGGLIEDYETKVRKFEEQKVTGSSDTKEIYGQGQKKAYQDKISEAQKIKTSLEKNIETLGKIGNFTNTYRLEQSQEIISHISSINSLEVPQSSALEELEKSHDQYITQYNKRIQQRKKLIETINAAKGKKPDDVKKPEEMQNILTQINKEITRCKESNLDVAIWEDKLSKIKSSIVENQNKLLAAKEAADKKDKEFDTAKNKINTEQKTDEKFLGDRQKEKRDIAKLQKDIDTKKDIVVKKQDELKKTLVNLGKLAIKEKYKEADAALRIVNDELQKIANINSNLEGYTQSASTSIAQSLNDNYEEKSNIVNNDSTLNSVNKEGLLKLPFDEFLKQLKERKVEIGGKFTDVVQNFVGQYESDKKKNKDNRDAEIKKAVDSAKDIVISQTRSSNDMNSRLLESKALEDIVLESEDDKKSYLEKAKDFREKAEILIKATGDIMLKLEQKQKDEILKEVGNPDEFNSKKQKLEGEIEDVKTRVLDEIHNIGIKYITQFQAPLEKENNTILQEITKIVEHKDSFETRILEEQSDDYKKVFREDEDSYLDFSTRVKIIKKSKAKAISNIDGDSLAALNSTISTTNEETIKKKEYLVKQSDNIKNLLSLLPESLSSKDEIVVIQGIIHNCNENLTKLEESYNELEDKIKDGLTKIDDLKNKITDEFETHIEKLNKFKETEEISKSEAGLENDKELNSSNIALSIPMISDKIGFWDDGQTKKDWFNSKKILRVAIKMKNILENKQIRTKIQEELQHNSKPTNDSDVNHAIILKIIDAVNSNNNKIHEQFGLKENNISLTFGDISVLREFDTNDNKDNGSNKKRVNLYKFAKLLQKGDTSKLGEKIEIIQKDVLDKSGNYLSKDQEVNLDIKHGTDGIVSKLSSVAASVSSGIGSKLKGSDNTKSR